jgi:diguanylate cyclase (GGDEF) domain
MPLLRGIAIFLHTSKINNIGNHSSSKHAKHSYNIRYSRRTKTAPFSLIIFDIDDFKKINDTYGHDAGDFILKQIDIFGAYVVSEKLRKIVETTNFTYKDKTIKTTVSLGVAEFGKNDTKETLFKKADRALYVSKTSGKNMSYLFFGDFMEV